MRRTCECCECGAEIEKGEDYYYINGESICTECIPEYAVEMMAVFRVEGDT